jgi:hypothetical protein
MRRDAKGNDQRVLILNGLLLSAKTLDIYGLAPGSF